MSDGITAEGLVRAMSRARLGTRRLERRDGETCHAALLVARGSGTEVHWMRWHAGDLSSRVGGTSTLPIPMHDLVEGDVADLSIGATDPLGPVLPHHASPAVAAFMPEPGREGRLPPRQVADALAVSLCPTHGLLRDALGGDAAELVATTGKVAGLASFQGTGTVAANRRRAARLQPSFVHALQGRRAPALAEATDAGGDVEGALGDAILLDHPQPDGVAAPSRAALRRLRGIRLDAGIDGAVYAMGTLPAEWLPRDAAGWSALSTIASGVKGAGFPPDQARRMLSACKGDWTRALAGLESGATPHWTVALARVAALVDGVAATLVAPALAGMGAGNDPVTVRRLAATLTVGDHGLREVVGIGRERGRSTPPVASGERIPAPEALRRWRDCLDPRWRRVSLDHLRSLAEPDAVGVEVTTAEGADVDRVCDALRAAGMHVLSAQAAIRMVTGLARPEALEAVRAVAGVVSARADTGREPPRPGNVGGYAPSP